MSDQIKTTARQCCRSCVHYFAVDADCGDCELHAVPVPAEAGTECADWQDIAMEPPL